MIVGRDKFRFVVSVRFDADIMDRIADIAMRNDWSYGHVVRKLCMIALNHLANEGIKL